MLLFYHGIGVLIMVIGTFIIEHIVPEYQEASVPLSIISVLAARTNRGNFVLRFAFLRSRTPSNSLGRGNSMGNVAYLKYRHA